MQASPQCLVSRIRIDPGHLLLMCIAELTVLNARLLYSLLWYLILVTLRLNISKYLRVIFIMNFLIASLSLCIHLS